MKKNDRIAEDDSPTPTLPNKPTETSDKEQLFKLAEEMKHEREDLSKLLNDFSEKYKGYLKIKKLMEEIEAKYAQRDGKVKDDIPVMISYE